MQNNPNTNTYLVDPEDWAVAFEPYEEKPDQALRLGLNLSMLRTELDGMLIKSQPVMESLDDALEILFPFTSFHDALYAWPLCPATNSRRFSPSSKR